MRYTKRQFNKKFSSDYWLKVYAKIRGIESNISDDSVELSPHLSTDKKLKVINNQTKRLPVNIVQSEQQVRHINNDIIIKPRTTVNYPYIIEETRPRDPIVDGSLELNGESYLSLTGAFFSYKNANSQFDGAGSLSMEGNKLIYSDITLQFDGASSLSVQAGISTIQFGDVQFDGAGTTSIQGNKINVVKREAAFGGAGSFAGAGEIKEKIDGAGSFAGAGSFVAEASVVNLGAGSFEGSGVLAGTANKHFVGAGTVAGTGALQGNAVLSSPVTPDLTADGFGTTSIGTGATTGTVNYPGTPDEGDLIVIVIGGFSTWSGDFDSAGFTEIGSGKLAVYAKKAGSSEGTSANFANKSTSQRVEAVSFFIEKDTWYENGSLTNTFAISSIVNSIDPPSLNAGWGDIKALWFAPAYVNYGNLTTRPTGYTTDYAISTTGSPHFIFTGVALRDSDPTAETENPGSWGGAGSGSEGARTVAIRGSGT
jgi:hypothetical protein